MDDDTYDELLHRLVALVTKLDQTYDQLVEFNRQQVEINQQLKTLVAEALRQRPNGQEP